ncbi:TPA: hypothetical protein ACH3X1_001580 [Trebouxia sp. C0004]
MGVKRKACKCKAKSGAKKQQQHRKTNGLREKTAPKQGAARLHFWPKVDTKATKLICYAFMPVQLVKSCCLQVTSCLIWLLLLSVPTLVLVIIHGQMDSVPSGAALSTFQRSVLATLPDLVHTSSVALMTAAGFAALQLAETACGPSHKHKHKATGTGAMCQALIVGVKLVLYSGAALLFSLAIHAVATSPMFWRMCKEVGSQMGPVPSEMQAFLVTVTFAGAIALLEESSLTICGIGKQVRKTAGSLVEAAIVLLEMTCYTLMPMLFADIKVNVVKTILVWSSQAGFEVLALETRMWELLPVCLMIATSSALLVEGCYVLYSKRMSPNTNAADMMGNATSSQPKHKQVHVAASKRERQKHADKLQHLQEKTTRSASGSVVVQPNDDISNPLKTTKAARSPSLKWQPVGNDGKSSVNDRHDLNTDRQEGNNGQKASIKTFAPINDAQSASKGNKLNANKVSTRPMTNNSNSNNRQVEAAPAFNSKASKGNSNDTTKGLNSDPSHSKAGGRQSTNSKTSFNKAAGNTGAKSQHKPAAVEAADNWDDGYLAAVRAMLKKAVGEPCLAQLQIAQSVAGVLKAVPAWMLAFGDANNQGCTAHAGLQSFEVARCSQLHTAAPKIMQLIMHCSLVIARVVPRQLDSMCTVFVCCYNSFYCRLTSACVWQSVLNGEQTNRGLQTVLRDVTKTKSMALLLRTIVAADVQSQLEPSPSGQESDGRLMAMDILRLSPEEGKRPELHTVPEWQLNLLHQKLALELQSL